LTKVIAATNPQFQIYAMTRKDPMEAAENSPETSRFKNISFV